ncbi:hypothetical protein D3C78_365850 [compost metagenome]
MQGRGHLVDLAELLLHALAGLAGDQRRLVGGATGVAHRDLDLGDHRLQLVEEAVEGQRQAAQFVAAGIGQAAGEVAFALGNVFQHGGQAQQRAGHAEGGQPDQHDAQQRGGGAQAELQCRALQALLIHLHLEGFGGRQQHLLRHAQQHAPGLGAGDGGEGFEHADVALVVEGMGLAPAQVVEDFAGLIRQHRLQALAELDGILAMAGDYPGRADDADGTVSLVQPAAGGQGVLLQAVEADIEADHGDHLAVLQQGEGDAGDQLAAAGGFVEVGLQQAQLPAVARAGEKGVEGRAAGAGGGVGQQLFIARHRMQFARLGLQPVEGEAPGVVAAELASAAELGIAAVQGVGLEDQVQAEQVGTLLHRLAQFAGQGRAQGLRVQLAPGRSLAQVEQVACQAHAVFVGAGEAALDLQRLHLALGLQVEARGFGQHAPAGILDPLRAGAGLVERQADQQAHHQDQAEARQQGDLALDAEAGAGHGVGRLQKPGRRRPGRGQNRVTNTSWL